MTCHEGIKKDSAAIRRLATYQGEGKSLPWARVYQIPDYVFFSHAKHVGAKVDCAACHGSVTRSDTLRREVRINMKFCMDCHRARSARNECNVCHELGQ